MKIESRKCGLVDRLRLIKAQARFTSDGPKL